MSIPLVQNNEKDAINTSIIAIKRNIERINMLLGLSNSEKIDTSKFATKEELEDAVTQVETDLAPVDEVTSGNMQSVTSNAVAEFIGWVQKDDTYVKKAGFFIEQMLLGIYSIRWYWTDNNYYYIRMNGTTSKIQFGYVENGTDYIYRTI